MPESKHSINVLNPERHGGDGLNNSYISYEITSSSVKPQSDNISISILIPIFVLVA